MVLLFVLATLNSCDDYENKADIENQETQNINHDEVGDEDDDDQLEGAS